MPLWPSRREHVPERQHGKRDHGGPDDRWLKHDRRASPESDLRVNSLGNRQGALLQNLAGVCEKLAGLQRLHLIGHSTGGVDAQLLACTKSFDGHAWDKKANAVRKKIKSVVTISAPHYGTGLADSRLARWGENPLRHPTAILPEARTLIDLLLLVPRDLAAAAGFEYAAPNDVIKFMWQVARNRDLIEDLKPERMEAVRARLSSDPEIALTCFVTGTAGRRPGRRWRDLRLRDRPLVLAYAPYRVRCRRCGVRVERVPWAARWARVTTALARAVAVLARKLSWAEVAAPFGLDWKTVAAIIREAVATGLQRRRWRPLDG